MYIAGIDPGKKGAIAIVEFKKGKITTKTVLFNNDCVSHVCQVFTKKYTCVLEKVHSLHGQGVASSFEFGKQFGLIIGSLDTLKISYELVSPQTWQRPFNLLSTKDCPKKRAKEVFNKLIGGKLSEGEMDATLMAISLFIRDNPSKIPEYFGEHNILKYDIGEKMNLEEIKW